MFEWLDTDIAFIEFLNAIFECGAVGAVNGTLTKKEFMQAMFTLFNKDVKNWEVTLNKAMSRENPAKFIDKLKATILKHNED